MKCYFKVLMLEILVLLCSCTRDNEQIPNETLLFKVTTDTITIDYSNYHASTIRVNVFGTADQPYDSITDQGVCYSEKKNPTISDQIAKASTWSASTPNVISIQVSDLKPNTIYHFRIFATTRQGLQYGNDLEYVTTNLPIFASASIKYFTRTTISYRFWLMTNGGSPLLSSGIVWNKLKNPTIDLPTKMETKTVDEHNFTGLATGLEPATKYFARCYAINKNGVAYSHEFTINTLGGILEEPISDIDGNVYKTIKLGNQVWMMENLRTTRFRNGDLIGSTSTVSNGMGDVSEPKYQWAVNGDDTNTPKYGRLYTWYTTTDSRNIAPLGWHVPTYTEFETLINYLQTNGYNIAANSKDFIGKALASDSMWIVDNTIMNVGCDVLSNNDSGFNALPTGIRNSTGKFEGFGSSTYFWSCSSEYFYGGIGYNLSSDSPYFSMYLNCNKTSGFSIRCIKDAP